MSPEPESHHAPVRRAPLRLRLAPRLGVGRLDGAWWPQSRDRSVEVGDLADHFPAAIGRIARLSVSSNGFDPGPVRVRTVRGGFVKVGSSVRGESHTALVTLMDRSVLQLVLVPASFSAGQGARVLDAAVASGNQRAAVALLGDVM